MPSKTKTLILLLTTAVVLNVFIFFKIYSIPSSLTCSTRFISMSKGERINMIMQFNFYEKTGIVILDGDAVMSNGQVQTLNRKVAFSFSKINNSYDLTSKKISLEIDDNMDASLLRRNLPDFFINKGAVINYGIYSQKPNGYVFSSRILPNFYCSS